MKRRLPFSFLPSSPLAFLPPVFALAGALTFGHSFGPAGGLAGLLVGLLVGLGMGLAWSHFMIAKGTHRERDLRDRLVDDLMAGRIRPRTSPPAPPPAVEPIPLEPAASPMGRVPPVEIATDLQTAITNVEGRAALDLDEAMRAAEALCEAHPRDGRATGLLARLVLRTGRSSEACMLASDAIQMTLLAGHTGWAVQVLDAFWAAREDLTFDAASCVALAQALLDDENADRARWCLDQAVARGAPEDEIERRLRRRMPP